MWGDSHGAFNFPPQLLPTLGGMPAKSMQSLVLFFVATLLNGCGSVDSVGGRSPFQSQQLVVGPYGSINQTSLAVIINEQDPDSVAIGNYYSEKRGIPPENVFHVSFTPGAVTMPEATFVPLHASLMARMGSHIQGMVLTWMRPYRVECMSVTSAFALGFNRALYCATPCAGTSATAYYNSSSAQPFTDYGIRPTMALAGTSKENVFALIDRGIAAEHSFPVGKGFAVRTSDTARSVRWPDMMPLPNKWTEENIDFTYQDNASGGSNTVTNETDVLFYFTGLTQVAGLTTNTYLPGAVADHLTSYAGVLDGAGQMPLLRWIEAGVCGSYGTVVEPCNFTAKFPQVSVLLDHYYRGETLLEAYWKSVRSPGEGIFVGDPLTRPWGTKANFSDDGMVEIDTTALKPGGSYELQQGTSYSGSFKTVQSGITVPTYQKARLIHAGAGGLFFRIKESP